MKRFKLTDVHENIMYECDNCMIEFPECEFCGMELDGGEYYCDTEIHICLSCYKKKKHRRKK
jgi:hypothetical protein